MRETWLLEVAGRGIRMKCGKHMETTGTGWGELRVGLCWALMPDSTQSSWRGGLCERTGPSLYGVAVLSRRIFSKRKRPWGALCGILLQQQLQSPLHPATCPSGECAHPLGSVCMMGECQHLISEGTEATGTGDSVNQGRLCMHTHSLEEAYH